MVSPSRSLYYFSLFYLTPKPGPIVLGRWISGGEVSGIGSGGNIRYSNSSADNLNQLFFFHCEQSYYPHSSKNVVLFMSFQIFRAKIEPGKDIYPRFLQLLLYRYNIWLRLSKFNITFQHSHSFSHFSLNLSDICLLVNIK